MPINQSGFGPMKVPTPTRHHFQIAGVLICLCWINVGSLCLPAAERVLTLELVPGSRWQATAPVDARVDGPQTGQEVIRLRSDQGAALRLVQDLPSPDLVPTRQEIAGWIQTICDQGLRRAGHPADLWVEQYLADTFAAWGLQDIVLQAVPLKKWTEGATVLTANVGAEAVPIQAFPFAFVEGSRMVSGEILHYRSNADLDQVAGRMVVVDYYLNSIKPSAVRDLATAIHDPENTLDATKHVIGMPHASPTADTVTAILQRNPAAVIAVMRNYFDTDGVWGVHENRPEDTSSPPFMPCVWVDPAAGTILDDALARGATTLTLSVDCHSEWVVSHNVIARLPGTTDYLVQVASHHDGAFTGATEDAAGVGLVMAQARYWSRMPQADRPHSFIFLVTAGHLKGALGEQAYIAAYPDWIDQTVLDVHLETPAREYDIQNGRLVDTGRPEPRNLYTSQVANLNSAVVAAVGDEDLRRTMVFPADAFSQPRCAAGRFFLAGVPVAAILGGPPVYYFDAADTYDKVDLDGLLPITRTMIRVIHAIRGQTPASMRPSSISRAAEVNQ